MVIKYCHSILFLKDKSLWIDGNEVGVIYLRCGYHPDQYPTEREWEARLMMERSKAIKSPSIQYHLAGTKKVQQELSKTGMVEKFLGDKAQIESIRDIFTGLYSLDHVSKKRKISRHTEVLFVFSSYLETTLNYI